VRVVIVSVAMALDSFRQRLRKSSLLGVEPEIGEPAGGRPTLRVIQYLRVNRASLNLSNSYK
jgi:hypothetical protein